MGMEDMKKNFIRNEEKIKTNSENFIRNEEKIRTNSENFIRNEEKIKKNSENYIRTEEKVKKNSANLATLATRGIWCGYTRHWNTTGTIFYEEQFLKADSNMEITDS